MRVDLTVDKKGGEIDLTGKEEGGEE